MADGPYLGEIRIFAGNYAPSGWALCDGSLLPIAENVQLFQLIGTKYGGNGASTFALPDLRGRLAIHQDASFPVGTAGGQEAVVLSASQIPGHSHAAQAVTAQANRNSPAGALWAGGSNSYIPAHPTSSMSSNNTILSSGGNQPHDNMMPFLTINFIIALEGFYPSAQNAGIEFFMAEVRTVAFDFAPGGWQLANGQTLPIMKNQALYSILGNAYGGDGRDTFDLPNLQGRTAIHAGHSHSVGEHGGEQAHTLTVQELPSHSHAVNGNAKSPNPSPTVFPAGAVWGAGNKPHYSNENPSTTMNAGAISPAGGGQPHNNMSPYLSINYIIRTGGRYPRRT